MSVAALWDPPRSSTLPDTLGHDRSRGPQGALYGPRKARAGERPRLKDVEQAAGREPARSDELLTARSDPRHADGGGAAGERLEQRVVPAHAHEGVGMGKPPLHLVDRPVREDPHLARPRLQSVPRRVLHLRPAHQHALPGRSVGRLDEGLEQREAVLAAARGGQHQRSPDARQVGRDRVVRG